MTTIAYKDGFIATDGQKTCGDIIEETDAIKAIESEGRIFFWSGGLSHIERFALAYPDGEVEEDSGTAAFVIDDGELWRAIESGGKVVRWKHGSAPWAYGSGYEFALGAMHAGASAAKAVRVAARLDVGTGGTIRVYDAKTGGEVKC